MLQCVAVCCSVLQCVAVSLLARGIIIIIMMTRQHLPLNTGVCRRGLQHTESCCRVCHGMSGMLQCLPYSAIVPIIEMTRQYLPLKWRGARGMLYGGKGGYSESWGMYGSRAASTRLNILDTIHKTPHLCEWVMSPIRMSYVTFEWVWSHIWMSHVTRLHTQLTNFKQ